MLLVPVPHDSILLTCYACENKTFVNIDPFDSTHLRTDECNHDASPNYQRCADGEVSMALVKATFKDFNDKKKLVSYFHCFFSYNTNN